jgi:hypothetical protein
MTKLTRPWHDCLLSLKTEPFEKVTPEMQQRFNKGIKIHDIIKQFYPEFSKEHQTTPDGSGVYSDSDLPVDISFHVDMWDAKHKIAWEIKPANWFTRNPDYCLAQASGYLRFMDARTVQLLLYRIIDPRKESTPENVIAFPYNPPYLYTWPELKLITLKSLEMLKGRK